MKKQTVKLTGIIIFDMLLIILPLYTGIDQILINTIGYILTILVSLTIPVTLFSSETSGIYKAILDERKGDPDWWITYDIVTDILTAVAWWSIGWESVSVVLVVDKLLLAINYPEYYLLNKKENKWYHKKTEI